MNTKLRDERDSLELSIRSVSYIREFHEKKNFIYSNVKSYYETFCKFIFLIENESYGQRRWIRRRAIREYDF